MNRKQAFEPCDKSFHDTVLSLQSESLLSSLDESLDYLTLNIADAILLKIIFDDPMKDIYKMASCGDTKNMSRGSALKKILISPPL